MTQVNGYSMRNEDLFQCLEKAVYKVNVLFWCTDSKYRHKQSNMQALLLRCFNV